MPKVLIITAGCDATDVGECWSAHQWVAGLAERFDVTLLNMRRRHRPPAAPQLPGVRVVEWLDWPLFGRFERFNSMVSPGYLGFYMWAKRWIKSSLAKGERFDLAHQLSPLAPRYPSPLADRGIPYIIGPLGGCLTTPAAFAEEVSGAPWFVRWRSIDQWRIEHDRMLRASYANADMVLGVAPYVRELLRSIRLRRFELMSETGAAGLPALPARREARQGHLKLLYVGRAVRTKGLRDAVRAMAQLRDFPGITLDAIGDGEDLEACKQEAARLGVMDRIHLHGRRPREEVNAFYRNADAFIFPSFREASGNVVFESLSFGLPAIVSDRGGPAYVVDESCGIRVPATDPEMFAQGLARAARALAMDTQLRQQLSHGARQRIEAIALWPAKIEHMASLYHSLVNLPQEQAA